MAADMQIQTFPRFGVIAFIRHPSWAAHVGAIRANTSLTFDTARFPYFDRMLAETSRLPALYNNLHGDYAHYTGLRTNIAVLRNHLAASAFGYSPFATADEQHIPRLTAIAATLGEAIAEGNVSIEMTTVEGVGAAQLYKYLLRVQQQPGFAAALIAFIRKLRGLRDMDFRLARIEATPFSGQNLAAAPPENMQQESKPAEASPPPEDNFKARDLEQETSEEIGTQLTDIGEYMMVVSVSLGSVEELELLTKNESVEEARKILRWLRNLQATDKTIEEWLDQGSPDAALAKTEKLMQLVNIFAHHLQLQKQQKPEMQGHSAVLDAIEAIRTLTLAIGEKALLVLPAGHARGAGLDAALNTVPESWNKRGAQSVLRLLNSLELGLERVLGKAVSELSAGEKLAIAGASLSKNADALRSVTTLQAPAREESVELAREILDKLRNTSFNEKTPKQMVDTGQIDEKVAFAQTLDEGVESYKNIVAGVVQVNPGALADRRLQEANDAVGSFSQSVKLMAAKELGANLQTQEQMAAIPPEWNALQNRSVNRLLKHMQSGLEKAVSMLQQQEQQQQRTESRGQENTQSQDATARRRRRRSTGTQQQPRGVATARRQAIDLTADDMALRQGAFRDDRNNPNPNPRRPPTAPATMRGLKNTDLDTVKELAGTMRGIDDVRPDLAMTSVSLTDKITPDDKGQASNVARLGGGDNLKKGIAAKTGAKPSNPNKRN